MVHNNSKKEVDSTTNTNTNTNTNTKTSSLTEELALALDRDEVDELGFPRKRLTETQHQCVNELYKKERGSNNGRGIQKSVIFDRIGSNNNDPFNLKNHESEILDTPDNKWWHRWNAWLEEKRMERERRMKKAAEEVRMISEAMSKKKKNNQPSIAESESATGFAP